MPRRYFHHQNGVTTLDPHGIDVSDMAAIRDEAVATIAAILREDDTGSLWTEQTTAAMGHRRSRRQRSNAVGPRDQGARGRAVLGPKGPGGPFARRWTAVSSSNGQARHGRVLFQINAAARACAFAGIVGDKASMPCRAIISTLREKATTTTIAAERCCRMTVPRATMPRASSASSKTPAVTTARASPWW